MRRLGDTPATVPAAVNPNMVDLSKADPALLQFPVSLTSNQQLPDLSLTIPREADFLWTAIYGTSTGTYKLLVRLGNRRPLMNTMIPSTLFVGTSIMPGTPGRPVLYPRGGAISIDIQDTSAAPNAVTLIFKGFLIYS